MKYALNHGVGRTLAATLGTLPLALAAALMLSVALPLSFNIRFAVGALAFFPLWVTASCFTFLAPSARRAWLGVLGTMALAAAITAVGLLAGRAAPLLRGSP